MRLRLSRRNTGRFVLFAAGAVLATALVDRAVTPLHAQNADPVIRSESRLVLVDAVAVDKKGKFARDLQAKDFKISEDGKEQTITSFSLETASVSPERSGKHYIVMYFDATGGGQLTIRQQVGQFIDRFASPDRYMSVLSYNYGVGLRVARNFTTDPALLKRAVNSIQPATTATGATHDYLESLRDVARSLSAVKGRKALVIFGGSTAVVSENTQDLLDTILALNKANVAVYSAGSGVGATSVGGMDASEVGAPARAGGRGRGAAAATSPSSVSSALSFASALADGTGGVTFLSTNDLAADLGKIAQEQDQYYLLGYTPAIESAEGSCHNLTVKVDRGDLEIRARKSYCTEKPPDVLSGKPLGADLEARAANDAAGGMSAKMQLPWFYSAPNVARVNLAMDINVSAMKFVKEKGKLHGELNLAGVATKPDGSIVARVSDTVNLDFVTQQQEDAFLAAPYHYENQFDLAPGEYNFRMAFSSGASDAGAFGKVELPLKIDPWNGQTLSASGLALSRDGHPSADLTAGLDPSLLEGVRPLVAKGTEVVPAGNTQFQKNEPALFYLEVYEPLLASAKGDSPLPLVGIRIRVLDRATGQQKEDTGVKTMGSFMRPGNPVVTIVSPLAITNLPAGSYRLEVSVMRQTGSPVVRTADFDVN